MTSRPPPWTADQIGDQRGRLALITGANSGIGAATALALARAGARVVLACRDLGRADAAAARLREQGAGAAVETLRLDLASLTSVRSAAKEFHDRFGQLDLLINNAGLMIPPYGRTEDGFELQFGTNHLGHFAFTGLLLDRLLATPGSRVVTVSSVGHRRGRIRFDDLAFERGYDPFAAYAQSKLANLLFAFELQRRLAAAGPTSTTNLISVAAHPGVARTELTRHSPALVRGLMSSRMMFLARWLVQDEHAAALPSLRAATDPTVRGGDYYGPDGPGQLTGRHPVRVRARASAYDAAAQRRLWTVSEELTGVRYDLPA